MYERVYCWLLIILGIAGGVMATYTAVTNIVSVEFQTPCYLQDGFFDISNETVVMGAH